MENKMSDKSLYRVLNQLKPYLAMVSLQFGYAGLHIVTLLSLKHGMSNYVLTVYRHAVATAVIAPFAFVFERKTRPKLTFPTFIKIAVLALLEPVIDQNLYYMGLKYTSATFASALFNILPAITFIMAVVLRIEKVRIKKLPSQAKVVGTLLTVAGAMVMTLYKGPLMDFFWSRGRSHHETNDGSADRNWVKGTLMLVASCTGWSSFFILQSFTLKSYPAELSLSTLICFLGTVQGAAVALVMDHKASAWSVGWDTRLLAPVYSGIVCSGIAYYVQGVVNKERGPVFVTAFNPLCMVIVAVLGSLILAEEIHLGRLIGAVIIVIGLYAVVWGKSKDPVAEPQSAGKSKGVPELPITEIIADSSKTNSKHCDSGAAIKLELSPKEFIPKK